MVDHIAHLHRVIKSQDYCTDPKTSVLKPVDPIAFFNKYKLFQDPVLDLRRNRYPAKNTVSVCV